MITVFEKWGLPKHIKLDNGLPFGDPAMKIIPLLSLWLIGLGIKVIFNRPGKPTDNSKVERMQAVTNNWTDPSKCKDIDQAQQALNYVIDIQRNHYKLKRKGHKTRRELFPKLYVPYKKYDAQAFDMQHIYNFLAEGYWQRFVSKTGQIAFYDQRFYIGRTYARQIVHIRFDLNKNSWQVADDNDNIISDIKVKNISQVLLCDLTKLSKN